MLSFLLFILNCLDLLDVAREAGIFKTNDK